MSSGSIGQFADIGSGRIGYERRGHGPAVVLSHASLVDRRMWRAQIDALADDFDVIAYDRLGHGESSMAPPRVQHAVDLLRVLDALGLERAVLIGSSMGGGYSLEAALLAPDRVTGLVTICAGLPGYEWPAAMRAEARELLTRAVPLDRLTAYTAHSATSVLDADIEAMAEAQLRYMAVGPGRTPDVFEPATWQLLLEMAAGVFAREWREAASQEIEPDPPLLARLSEIAVPTLVISGLSDVSYVQEVSTLLARGIPGARTVELADTGHLPPVERPAEIAGILHGYLAALTQ